MHRGERLRSQKARRGLHFQHPERDRIGGHKKWFEQGTVAICGTEKKGGRRAQRWCKLSVEFSEWSRGGERGLLEPQQETSPWRLCWFSFIFLITVTIFDKSSSWKEGLFWLTVWRCIVAGKAGQQGQEDTGLIASASESKQGDYLRVHSSFTLPRFFLSPRSQPTGWCHSH